jgi:hypothetical protein
VTVACAAFALAGCSASADPEPTTAPTQSATAPAADMTCDSIMRASFVDQLKDLGWVAQAAQFRIGEHVLDGGIQCVWGDESGLDSGQMYGWAPIDAETSLEMQTYLEDNGWVHSDDGEYVYLSEDPTLSYAENPDEVITYQFAPGWVALADTKSGLALVTWRG